MIQAALASGALERIVRKAHKPCRWIYTLDDFRQDILCKVLARRDQLRGKTYAEFLGWTKAISNNLMIDLLRKSRGRAAVPLPAQVPDRKAGLPHEILSAREEQDWVESILGQLEPIEREILTRHYHRGERLSSIAEALGQLPNTIVRKHLRLIAKLGKLRGCVE